MVFVSMVTPTLMVSYRRPRRWDAKFDAKGLVAHAIVLRCAAPTGRRKVPLHFDAWVVMMDPTAENVFNTSQLISDRPIRGQPYRVSSKNKYYDVTMKFPTQGRE